MDGIYFGKDDVVTNSFTGECFCLQGDTLEGLLRGTHVKAKQGADGTFTVTTAQGFSESISITGTSGSYSLQCAKSKEGFQQVLESTAASNMCIGMKYTGLWVNKADAKSTMPILAANGYWQRFGESPVIGKAVSLNAPPTVLTLDGEGSTVPQLNWDLTGKGDMVSADSSGGGEDMAQIGALGTKMLEPGKTLYNGIAFEGSGPKGEAWGLLVLFGDKNYAVFMAPVTGDVQDVKNWDEKKMINAILATALVSNTHTLFLGEWGTKDEPKNFVAKSVDGNTLEISKGPATGHFVRKGPINSPFPGQPGEKKKKDDDSGLFVALLLGLLGYALVKS